MAHLDQRTLQLAYGRGTIDVEFPAANTQVVEPTPVPGVPDEHLEFSSAIKKPIGARPLSEWIKPESKVCIVFTDITRATPNERLIPWILTELETRIPREQIILLNGTGTHRANTREELEALLTPEVVRNYRVLNHDAKDRDGLVEVGRNRRGFPALINRHLVEANLRIITGFIEPHFFAGFSGGPKGIMPGVAGLETVMQNHSGTNLGSPNATFGVLEGNPIWEEMRDIALRVGESFLINVTLNEQRQITGVFAGDLVQAHQAGCEHVRQSAMQKVEAPFDLVVTTNSGYPLDQSLYQAVKGMSAAARIVKEGGTIVMASECSDGLPEGSPYEQLLNHSSSFEDVFKFIMDPSREEPEQWQVIVQMVIQRRAEVLVYSSLPDEKLIQAKLAPCKDIGETVRQRMFTIGEGARIAVLPQGPLTIPYLGNGRT